MCERFNLWSSSVELAEFFELQRDPISWTPRYNISPTQRVLIVRTKSDGIRIGELMQWGLVPSWATDPSIGFKLFNAPSRSVFNKSTFRAAIRRRRCLIPATGFYEWKQLTESTKQPWHIFPKDAEPIAFAGLWERWRASDRTTVGSCSIITTEAHRFSRGNVNQMPVILTRDKWDSWLDPAQDYSPELAKLLDPCPHPELERTIVGDFVNVLRNDSQECIRPVGASQPLS